MGQKLTKPDCQLPLWLWWACGSGAPAPPAPLLAPHRGFYPSASSSPGRQPDASFLSQCYFIFPSRLTLFLFSPLDLAYSCPLFLP